jgi:hypothetical protein
MGSPRASDGFTTAEGWTFMIRIDWSASPGLGKIEIGQVQTRVSVRDDIDHCLLCSGCPNTSNTQLPHIVSQSIFNISRLMEATLRPSLETDLLAIFRATHVIPLPNVTERPEAAGVNWTMPTLVSRDDVVVEPPTQAYVELLGSRDIGHGDDVAL